jgi:hypothetical protein
MMDHERTEKELQEIFEEIQHSYRTSVENAIALQERTLEFARGLLETPERRGGRAELEDLADRSRRQRAQLERLTRKAAEAYMKVLKRPADEHHHKVEEAKADLEEASQS